MITRKKEGQCISAVILGIHASHCLRTLIFIPPSVFIQAARALGCASSVFSWFLVGIGERRKRPSDVAYSDIQLSLSRSVCTSVLAHSFKVTSENGRAQVRTRVTRQKAEFLNPNLRPRSAVQWEGDECRRKLSMLFSSRENSSIEVRVPKEEINRVNKLKSVTCPKRKRAISIVPRNLHLGRLWR